MVAPSPTPQTIRALSREERRNLLYRCARCINIPKYLVTTKELYPGEFGPRRTEQRDYYCGVHAQPWLRKRPIYGLA